MKTTGNTLLITGGGSGNWWWNWPPPYAATDLMNGAGDPRAMPLGAFIPEVMERIRTHPDAPESLVESVKRLRFAAETGTCGQVFKGFNDAMSGH